MNRWLNEGVGLTAYHTASTHNLQVNSSTSNANNNNHLKSNSYHGEQFVHADLFNELQHEVSSLLVLKDALLETFPHLHHRISTLPIQDVRRLPKQQPQQPHHQHQDQQDVSSDDITSSWNQLHRAPRRLRKSPEGSSTGSTVADSGFSTEKDSAALLSSPAIVAASSSRLAGGTMIAASATSNNNNGTSPPAEVRWDDGRWGSGRLTSPSPPPLLSPGDGGGGSDELMHLLDVIQRKAVKLRAQTPQDVEERRKDEARRLQQQQQLQQQPVRASLALGAILENTELNNGQLAARKRSQLEAMSRNDREFLVDRISELETETIRSQAHVARLEQELGRVVQQRDHLEDQLRRLGHRKEENGDGGIIHSVHILTGGEKASGGQGSSNLSRGGGNNNYFHHYQQQQQGTGSYYHHHQSRFLSQSESNLMATAAATAAAGDGAINIEIRHNSSVSNSNNNGGGGDLSRSNGDLITNRRLGGNGSGGGSKIGGGSVSVVNLPAAVNHSVEELYYGGGDGGPVFSSHFGGGGGGGKARYNNFLYPDRPRFFPHPLPATGHSSGRLVGFNTIRPTAGSGGGGQLQQLLSQERLLHNRSRSVENLYDQQQQSAASGGGGLRYATAATSEISLQPRPYYGDGNTMSGLRSATSATVVGSSGSSSSSNQHHQQRMKATQSEQVLTKIGKLEKVKLSESVVSMPAELARKDAGGMRIQPNRERIRQILATGSVLELQRQLLTTVMENEVYKTQLARISESWDDKVSDMEKVNTSLQTSLTKLKSENAELRLQVEEKSAELDKVRNKVNQLESSPTKPNPVLAVKQTQTEALSFSYSQLDSPGGVGGKTEPRVTFDLGPALGTAKQATAGAEPALRRPLVLDKPSSQLPSDARQRLQEMAGLDIRRNYRKTSENYRPSHLNLSSSTSALNNSAVGGSGGSNSAVATSRVASQAPTPTASSSVGAASTAAGRSSPTKAYPLGSAVELSNHHLARSGGGGSTNSSTTATPVATAVMRRDSRSNSRNSLVVTVQTSNNQKRPPGGAAIGGGGGREVIHSARNANNSHDPVARNAVNHETVAKNAINGTRTRTPSIERSIISNKDDPNKDANKEPRRNSTSSAATMTIVPPVRLLPAPPPPPPATATYSPLANPTSIEIKNMERDTIADLIAGILQKCSNNSNRNEERHLHRGSSSDGSTTAAAGGRTEAAAATHVASPARPPSAQQQLHNNNNITDSESITLSDDSLNNYSTPYIIQPVAAAAAGNLLQLPLPENDDDEIVDSLQPQFQQQQQRAPYPDSLNNHQNGLLFDSMEEEEERVVGERRNGGRRVIQPYLDNSLSTGSYTSEQEEEEEALEINRMMELQQRQNNNINLKANLARSPPREGGTPLYLASTTNSLYLASAAASIIRPASTTAPPPTPTTPLPLSPLPTALKPTQQSSYEAVTNQAKDDVYRSSSPGRNNAAASPQPRPPPAVASGGISLARQATERLKWKFLGW